MILILTNKQDTHADEMIRWLSLRDIDVFRLNTEDLLMKYRVTLSLEESGVWSGEIVDELGRILSLTKLRIAWFRKPEFDFLGKIIESPEEEFIVSETKSLINTLYSLPHIRWINNPFHANRAKNKFQQLLLAKQYGVKVPKTLITTHPEIAEQFFVECGNEVLIKAIYTSNVTINGMNQAIPSKKIGQEQFYQFYKNIAFSPTQLQEYVEKAFELRVTVIGNKVYAVKIDSQLHEETKVDWRLYTELNPHSIFELPPKIESFCISFLQDQQLLFGAMDFIVTPKGEYYFLENNPFGQYLWLEIETGIPLTEELGNLLISYLDSAI